MNNDERVLHEKITNLEKLYKQQADALLQLRIALALEKRIPGLFADSESVHGEWVTCGSKITYRVHYGAPTANARHSREHDIAWADLPEVIRQTCPTAVLKIGGFWK